PAARRQPAPALSAPYQNAAGEFALELPADCRPELLEDSASSLAVSFDGPGWRMLVHRLRVRIPGVDDGAAFEAVLAGVMVGIEDSLRPVRVLERRVEGTCADLVLRGRVAGGDVMERGRPISAASPVFCLVPRK